MMAWLLLGGWCKNIKVHREYGYLGRGSDWCYE
jgi:hypothetical protein